jgi:Phosphotransferase enzyme family
LTDLAAIARDALDLDGPLELLRASGGAVFRTSRGIVRVAIGGADGVRLAYDLAAAGAPIAAPIAGPVECDGHVVSLWRDVPDDGSRDAAAMGRALRRFHECAASFVDRVAVFDPLAWLDVRGVGGAVRQRAEALAPALRTETAVLLHTDAHAANFRVDAGRALLVDLELLAQGPALYDLAALEVTERRFRGDAAIFRRCAVAYGTDPSDPRLGPLIALREVLAVGFVAWLGHANVARRRLAELDDPQARWQPY